MSARYRNLHDGREIEFPARNAEIEMWPGTWELLGEQPDEVADPAPKRRRKAAPKAPKVEPVVEQDEQDRGEQDRGEQDRGEQDRGGTHVEHEPAE